MAITSKLYATFPQLMIAGNAGANTPVDILSDTINVALTTSTNTIEQQTDSNYGNLTNEVTGTGYTAGGATLGTKTLATASLTTTFDAADTVWTGVTFTAAAQAHVWDDTQSNNALISYVDFGGSQTLAGTDFQLTWHASGVFSIAVA